MSIKNIYLKIDNNANIQISQFEKFLWLRTSVRCNLITFNCTDETAMDNLIEDVINAIISKIDFKLTMGNNPYETFLINNKDLISFCSDCLVVKKIGRMIKEKSKLIKKGINENFFEIDNLTEKIELYCIYLDISVNRKFINADFKFKNIYNSSLRELNELITNYKKNLKQ